MRNTGNLAKVIKRKDLVKYNKITGTKIFYRKVKLTYNYTDGAKTKL
jgi:hypothetical protein